MKTADEKAAAQMDWQQVVLNGGPPCFYLEDGKFCGRAERWEGHGVTGAHEYRSLSQLLTDDGNCNGGSCMTAPTPNDTHRAETMARECADIAMANQFRQPTAIAGLISEKLNLPSLLRDERERAVFEEETTKIVLALGIDGKLEEGKTLLDSFVKLKNERDSLRAELDQVRKERNALRDFIWKETGCGEHTSLGEGLNRCKENFKSLHKLRTTKAALLEVARAAIKEHEDALWKGFDSRCDSYQAMTKALTAAKEKVPELNAERTRDKT